MSDLHDDERLAVVERRIDAWLSRAAAENPVIAAVDRDAG